MFLPWSAFLQANTPDLYVNMQDTSHMVAAARPKPLQAHAPKAHWNAPDSHHGSWDMLSFQANRAANPQHIANDLMHYSNQARGAETELTQHLQTIPGQERIRGQHWDRSHQVNLEEASENANATRSSAMHAYLNMPVPIGVRTLTDKRLAPGIARSVHPTLARVKEAMKYRDAQHQEAVRRGRDDSAAKSREVNERQKWAIEAARMHIEQDKARGMRNAREKLLEKDLGFLPIETMHFARSTITSVQAMHKPESISVIRKEMLNVKE